jgi:hypothetical protein
MKLMDSKIKLLFAALGIGVLILFEFGSMDGFRFIMSDGAMGGLSTTIKTITKDLGYNYICASFIVLLAIFGFEVFAGYHKNIGGLIPVLFFGICPFIGAIGGAAGSEAVYNWFCGWGTANLTPAMYILKLTGTDKTTAQMIFFAVLIVLYIVFWVVGRFMRKQHDLKNDF